MGRRSRATIADVARLAGVSRATVSRVLNGTAVVARDKEQAVHEAIDQTGFLVSTSARHLATGRTDSMAVILTEPIDELLEDPTYATVLKGIMDGLADTPMTPTLYMAATQGERSKSLRLFRRGAADALIHLSPYTDDELLVDLADTDIPVVLCGQTAGELEGMDGFSKVYSDDRIGAQSAARHLLDHGAARVGALMGPRENPATTDRIEGLVAMLGEHLTAGPVYGSWDESSGAHMATGLLSACTPFDALACGNDRIAAGAIRALQVAGVRVPQDVLVIGFDDHPIATTFRPSISTVHQPFHLQGVRAVGIARAMIEGDAPRTEILETQVFERESTAGRPLGTPRPA